MERDKQERKAITEDDIAHLPPRYLWMMRIKPIDPGFYCLKLREDSKCIIVSVWEGDNRDELYTLIDDQVLLVEKVLDCYYWGIAPIPDGVVVPRTALSFPDIQHKGMRRYRFESNPREKIFADEWEDSAKNILGYILSNSDSNRDDGIKSQRDATIAATMMQWLGTPVGWNFLQQAVEKCGYELIKKEDKDV